MDGMSGFIGSFGALQTRTRGRRGGGPARCRVETRAAAGRPPATSKRMEETFAEDAGKDLFFTGMDEEKAIELVTTGAGELDDRSDRYIAAERLKFYQSEASTEALVKCVLDSANSTLEDRIAKRKSVETLGRFKGRFLRDKVVKAVLTKLEDPDAYTSEVAVWTLAELNVTERSVLDRVTRLLERDDVNKRVIFQTLASLGYTDATDKIRKFVDSNDLATRCAAIGAIGRLTGDMDVMEGVVDVLGSTDLNTRRAAIEDITINKYYPAMDAVFRAPNSLVLRSRAARELLDAQRTAGKLQWDDDLELKVDRLIWDHPNSIDLLGVSADTEKARSITRCVERLYKNDALYSYLGARVLIEDHAGNEEAGAKVLESFTSMQYFDYFAAYHVFKALGWLRYKQAEEILLDNFKSLPPRFFNHQAGAALSLALIDAKNAYDEICRVAKETQIWELKYACMMAADLLGDDGALRSSFQNDPDWLISSRARSDRRFQPEN
mmetsp:Transcript_8687/g.26104  ORF Transcript_8687/g.26104 Transcript_8687/m.26104 type:complete len:495 (+) Transcript_8687:904-2388(+)